MASSASIESPDIVSRDHASLSAGGSSLAGKRVAMVTFSSFPFDPRPRRAAEAYVREGATVDLICMKDDNALKRESLNGIEVFRIPFKKYRGGKLAYAYQYSVFILISSAIFAFRSLTVSYDLVHVHNMPDILVASALIPKAFGAKVVLDLHDPMPELMMTIFDKNENSRGVRWLKRLEKWSLARADLVLSVNLACKRIFSSRSCPADKITVVMNAPDGQIFPFSPLCSDHSARVKDRALVVMYHGSLVERNGLDLAVDAFAQVRDKFPTAELRIYGAKTDFLDRVMARVRDRGLDDVIRYLGPKRLEDIVEEIKKCDVGVIPNHWNPFTEINTPTRIFEYLALGKPVIAPSTPGIQDYFDKKSLLFFEAGNSKNLAEQVEHALACPDEVAEIVRRGQQVYQAHTWERERDQFLGRVSEMLNLS